MPASVREGDISAGHSSFPPTPATESSDNVYINGIGAVRVGDAYAPHGSPSPSSPHDRVVSSGSSSVYVNGKPLARIGDDLSCGDVAAEGSSDVFAGG